MRALALALLFSGCSSILGLDDGVPLEVDGGIDPPDLFDAPVVVVELHVDPAGDDANDGSIFNPFRTIFKAASIAEAGWIIRVAPGTYQELTPIVVASSDVQIIGDDERPEVVSDLPGPVLELGSSTVRGLSISNIGGDGISVAGGGVVQDVEISVSGTGIAISSGAQVAGCTISAPTSTAIVSSSLEVILESNQITGSAVGITIEDTVTTGAFGSIANNIVVQNGIGMFIQMSGGVAELSAGNEISCNTNVDLNVSGGGEVLAPSTIWDHDPPTNGLFDPESSNNGVDTASDGATIVTAGDATVSNSPCP